jgi:hypothetical protein
MKRFSVALELTRRGRRHQHRRMRYAPARSTDAGRYGRGPPITAGSATRLQPPRRSGAAGRTINWRTICRLGQWQGNDCFHDHFFPGDEPTYLSRELRGLRVIGLDTYDKPGRGSDAGALSADQLAWFRAELARERDQPTIVFGHHPLIVENSPFPTSASNTLDAAQVATILDDYSQTPGPFLHHAGHTHRNKRTISAVAPGVTMQEIAAGKEYPGGFSLLRLYTGDFALNFYKTRSRPARAWSERIWPQFALGSSVSDRNTMVARDLSGLRAGRHRPDRGGVQS